MNTLISSIFVPLALLAIVSLAVARANRAERRRGPVEALRALPLRGNRRRGGA